MHAVCNLQAINWESIVCQILIIYFNMTHITNVQIFIFSGVSISKKNVVSQAKGWSSNFEKERCLHSLKKCKDDLDAIIIHETPHWVSGNIFSKSKLSGCAVHFQCFICWASTFYCKVITKVWNFRSRNMHTYFFEKGKLSTKQKSDCCGYLWLYLIRIKNR